MKLGCPWHQNGEEQDEEDDPWEPTAIPAKRNRKPRVERTFDILEAVEAIARVAIEDRTPVTEGAVPWIAPAPVPEAALGGRVSSGSAITDTLPWVLEVLLIGGASVLLGHGLKLSLPMAAQLELQLSGAVKQLSQTRAKGAAGQGFRVNMAERLAALSKGSTSR